MSRQGSYVKRSHHGARKAATDAALHAWVGGSSPAPDDRSVAEIVGRDVWALAEAEALRLGHTRPHVGPVDWARVGAAAEGAA